MKKNYENKQTGYSGKKEGEITINGKKANSKKKIDKSEGDYIDYEELK